MYRFEESRRVKELKFKQVAPQFLLKNDFLLHFKDEIFQGVDATCEFEIVGAKDDEYLNLEQREPFIIRKLYKQKFQALSESPAKVVKVVKKRVRRWRSRSPPKRRKRRWVSPAGRV